MDQGSLRCDVNVSLAPPGEPWGTRSETKNVNSLRSVERAVRFEIERQAAVLSSGGRVVQETRHFHEDTGETTSGRSRSTPRTTRYFPEPIWFRWHRRRTGSRSFAERCPRCHRCGAPGLQAQWDISDLEMQTLVNAEALDLVESTIDQGVDQAAARKWWTGEFTRIANEQGIALTDLPVTAATSPGSRS